MKSFKSLMLLSSLFLQIAYANQMFEFKNIKLISVYDGDTIKVRIPNTHPLFGEEISIRIRGIDTPEKRTKKRCEKIEALKARDLVRARLGKAKDITLSNCSRGKYFRLVCDVFYDKKNIAKELISKKFAYRYTGKTKRKINWCNFRKTASKGALK